VLLLDTDAVSHLLRGTSRNGLIEKVAAVPPHERCICAITLAELLYGLSRKGAPVALRQRLEDDLLPRMEVLPYDEAAARVYAEIRTDLQERLMPLGEADLQIAAIALARGLVLLTGNARHFSRVRGLDLEAF
jgi:tRNA(fMet)-specific endonuclease VapC